ncbi:PAS domain-containing protein [Mucilaginibacter sp.]|uniref:PAS domain-containing protein n=1 Tax=Mucilaginibacter sp. TaxID=1882438 RepID=UPI003D117F12
MKSQPHRFTNEKLIEILSLSQNATAIYTGEEITIQTANNVMLGFWGKDQSVIGKPLAEAVPELIGQPFLDLLKQVWLTGITYEAKDAAAILMVNGELQTFYFDFIYRAIKNAAGELDCILHTATDVTELNLGRNLIKHAKEQQDSLRREQLLNEELGATNEELSASNEELASALEELSVTNEELLQTKESLLLLNNQLETRVADRTKTVADLYQEVGAMNEELRAANEELASTNEELITTNEELSISRESLEQLVIELADSENKTRNIIQAAPFPIGVYTGREMRIAFANKAIMDVWGKGDEVVGQLYAEILPELDNQEVFKQLDEVFTTGKPFSARNQRIDLVVNGEMTTFYFNYDFTALTNEAGEVYGVMNTAADVTDVILAKQQLETAAHELAVLNEELGAVNEELIASNEEISATNEELTQTQENLNIKVAALAQSELRFRELIEQSPVAMQVFRGPDMTFEIVNEAMLEFLGKPASIIGKTLFEGVPEIVGQPIVELLYQVYHTGEAMEIKGIQVVLHRNGGDEIGYYNVSYRALYDDNRITGVLGIAIDVTTQVTAIHALQDSEQKLNIAIEAGNMGTWSINPTTLKITMSDFVKNMIGLPLDRDPQMEEVIRAIKPEYHQSLQKSLMNAIENGLPSDNEYEITNLINGEERWVKATGKVLMDTSGNASEYTGMFMDITERKLDELRKNDFIGMVSHELKTPLTSLTAYIQMLQTKARKEEDSFISGALDKANKQVKKMTTMINGFLNVSRLESGKIHIDSQRFDMASLVKEVEEETVVTVTSHQVIFAPVQETFVNADRDKIGQVFNNFISNAVKYSPLGTTINVACINVGNSVQVSVKDEGRGIRPEDQQKLFERYYRVKDQPTTISGFGIGLYVCAEVIHRHNGKIWVESTPGKGSTFYFTLPV